MTAPNWFRHQQDSTRASLSLANVRTETIKIGTRWYQIQICGDDPEYWGIWVWGDDADVSCPNWRDLPPDIQQTILQHQSGSVG